MNSSYLNNENLIKNLKKGEESAFVYLMNTYHNKLCVYARGLTKDHYTAQDIVQNVFFKVWEQRQKLNSGYNINNFLYRSVYNEFIDHYRKIKLLTPLEEEHIKQLKAIVQEDRVSEINNLIELVKQEIENLPPKCKSVFTMGKLEGLTYIEIAEYQKITVRTVEMHMSRAFEIIRKKIGDKTDVILFLLFGMQLKNRQSSFR
ncbi:RNA polymerase sigma factor [Snuella sedimenti]|uniref:RNA polymerase sigma-70 factor n=1 Tax=Snuella sedimenti TaxID=2798802 RepID=A0A8J7LRB4_9FLAO|nr:RNA polymerase sigma-70 factor [Snuella sedimenti]MBJ6366990.1 RNA polymerase sigma-70 factor [Snuella sedimenti]